LRRKEKNFKRGGGLPGLYKTMYSVALCVTKSKLAWLATVIKLSSLRVFKTAEIGQGIYDSPPASINFFYNQLIAWVSLIL
jgi:hypothetical protein